MTALFPEYRSPWETEDQQALRKHAAEFFRKEATPNQERWAEQHQVDREFWTKTGDVGLLCMGLPEEFGGGGGNFGHEAVVQQELALAHDTAFGFSVHSTIVAHYISAYATDEQKKRWIPKMASGEMVIGAAMTEPDTGSDLQAVRTTAIRDGDEYVQDLHLQRVALRPAGDRRQDRSQARLQGHFAVSRRDPGTRGLRAWTSATQDRPTRPGHP